MADAAVDVNAVNDIVRQAVQRINVNKQEQELKIQGTEQQPLNLNDRDVQHFVNLLERHRRAVSILSIERCNLTVEAVEILRAYFARRTMSLRRIHFNGVNLGNVNGGRLLSGLHGNTSVTQLDLFIVGLEGQAGGIVLSELLRNLSLTKFWCYDLRLGVAGAQALQASLRANQKVQVFALGYCDLGDDGISLIVDALQENNTMTCLALEGNSITSTYGLPHVTRLLHHASIQKINLSNIPGIFDNQDNFGQFLIALQNSQLNTVLLNFCRLPGHVMVALVRAILLKTIPTIVFGVCDNDPLHGTDLERLLDIISQIRHVHTLGINLNFMDESVLSAFRRNTSIQHLYTSIGGRPLEEITSCPVFDIMKRNRQLCQANMLLDSEPQQTIPLGLWSTAIERLTHDESTGATAVYKIMLEKLVMWETLTWTTVASPPLRPTQLSLIAATSAHVADTAAPAASTDASVVERSRTQASIGHAAVETNANSSSSSSSKPQRKRQRCQLSSPKSTGE